MVAGGDRPRGAGAFKIAGHIANNRIELRHGDGEAVGGTFVHGAGLKRISVGGNLGESDLPSFASRQRLSLISKAGPLNIVLWVYGPERSMKTTVELPDDLYRRAKAMAALRGRKLKDLVAEGLRLVLEAPRKARRGPGLAELMKGARGMIDSGVPDLASHPRHLANFGRDGSHH